ncbi:HalD/BesD family halogenase [Paraburkholderia sediminicola]|uniref:HalD/BesD family halogenase n=1 Tax=Paraburkholderia sediminicola TaxID=458836 RepID=UPI0038BAD5A1
MSVSLPLADAECNDLSDIVDTGRYPLHDPDHPRMRELIASCRAHLAGNGSAVLHGFLRPEALVQARAEGVALAAKTYFSTRKVNAYFTADDPSLPADDPRRVFMDRTSGFVTRDVIPADAIVHRIYVALAMKRFVAACLGEARVWEYADPYAGLVQNVMPPGTEQPWHYDTNEFIVSMMTQQPEAGGDFEYCPNIRSPQGENYGDVGSVVRGETRAPINVITLRPGDLQLFKGRFSLHRVTRVQGAIDRHTAIFAYSQKPGVIGRLERTRQLYGRVSEMHLEAEQRLVRADNLVD